MPHQPIRKRMKRYEIPGGCRFITFFCHHRLMLLGEPWVRDLFVVALYLARAKFGFELFAWVVMPEHVHLLVRPRPGVPLARALRFIKQSVATRMVHHYKKTRDPVLESTRLQDGRPRFWQPGGGFDRNVRDESEFAREVRYIHQNPVERALVEKPEDWKWSSVRWWMGLREGERECDPPPGKGLAWDTWKGFA